MSRWWAVALTLAACRDDARAPASPTSSRAAAASDRRPATPDPRDAIAAEAPPAQPPTKWPAPRRLVAFGDVHGDLAAARAVLRLAGAIDENDRWMGGDLVVVQTGDQLDRGDDEQAILDLFAKLADEAAAAGGAFLPLNGNHEFMNVAGDLRYVTEGGLHDFADAPGVDVADPAVASVPAPARARAAAFRPGGPYAKILARRNTAVVVGNTVFVHGGVLPEHVPEGVPSLERINAASRAWLLGAAEGREIFTRAVMADDGMVWTRDYSDPTRPPACERLGQALSALGATRMVVGHTVQEGGITSACDERVWRIDVGLARTYGGRTQALVIEGDRVSIVVADAP